jgi:hypothetical protein
MLHHHDMNAADRIGLTARTVFSLRPRPKLRHAMQEPCKRTSSARDFRVTFIER